MMTSARTLNDTRSRPILPAWRVGPAIGLSVTGLVVAGWLAQVAANAGSGPCEHLLSGRVDYEDRDEVTLRASIVTVGDCAVAGSVVVVRTPGPGALTRVEAPEGTLFRDSDVQPDTHYTYEFREMSGEQILTTIRVEADTSRTRGTLRHSASWGQPRLMGFLTLGDNVTLQATAGATLRGSLNDSRITVGASSALAIQGAGGTGIVMVVQGNFSAEAQARLTECAIQIDPTGSFAAVSTTFQGSTIHRFGTLALDSCRLVSTRVTEQRPAELAGELRIADCVVDGLTLVHAGPLVFERNREENAVNGSSLSLSDLPTPFLLEDLVLPRTALLLGGKGAILAINNALGSLTMVPASDAAVVGVISNRFHSAAGDLVSQGLLVIGGGHASQVVVQGNLSGDASAFLIAVSGLRSPAAPDVGLLHQIEGNTSVAELDLMDVEAVSVSGNEFRSSEVDGINLDAAASCQVLGNRLVSVRTSGGSSGRQCGIQLGANRNAFAIGPCRNNVIASNTITGYAAGISLHYAHDNRVHANRITGPHGLNLGGFDQFNPSPTITTFDNLIFDNQFRGTPSVSAVAANVGTNTFFQPRLPGPNVLGGPTIGGNSWLDHGGPDDNLDGFVDVPFVFLNLVRDELPLPGTVPLVVNSTGDEADPNLADGIPDVDLATPGEQITLRCALQNAALRRGPHLITFNLPGPGPHVIRPRSALPFVGQTVVIDATTDAGGVVLDGVNAGPGVSGLSLGASFCVVRGLAFVRFPGSGLETVGSSAANTIQGCRFGTDWGSNLTLGNGLHGVLLQGRDHTLGGFLPGTGNLILGNNGSGVHIGFGVDPGHGNLVAGNLIASNRLNGITVLGQDPQNLSQNRIFANGKLGIDLGGNGVSANDGRLDEFAPNRGIDFPVIDPLRSSLSNVVVTASHAPDTVLTVEFYASRMPDPSGNGEGEVFLGERFGRTAANGVLEVSFPLPADFTQFVTALARDDAGNTSEFSKAFGPILVNDPGDRPDASPTDNVADADLTKPGLQTTLRAAIEFANAKPGRDTILIDDFALDALGGEIHLLSPLPPITGPVTIVAASKRGTIIRAPDLMLGNFLELRSGDCVLKDLQFGTTSEGFGPQVSLGPGGGANRVSGCVFGCPVVVRDSPNNTLGAAEPEGRNEFARGLVIRGNASRSNLVFNASFDNPSEAHALEIQDAAENVIGLADPGASTGLENRFQFLRSGVRISGGGAVSNVVQNGIFDGAGSARPADTIGVEVDDRASGNLIGGPEPGQGNRIRAARGVMIHDGNRNLILRNTYLTGLSEGDMPSIPIDLLGDGITFNEANSQFGPNRLTPAPVIEHLSANRRVVEGQVIVGSTRPGPWRIDFFVNNLLEKLDLPGRGPFLLGRGDEFIGALTNVNARAGVVSFSFEAERPILGAITATATDAEGNTSEASQAFNEFVVTTLEDSDLTFPGSPENPSAGSLLPSGAPAVTLRSALAAANRLDRRVRITADPALAQTGGAIGLRTALPPVTAPIELDGSLGPTASQLPHQAGVETLLVQPAVPGSLAVGLELRCHGAKVRSLAVGGFTTAGIEVAGGGGNEIGALPGTVWLGVSWDAEHVLPNGKGLWIVNSPSNSVGNVVAAGNREEGLLIEGEASVTNRLVFIAVGNAVDLGGQPRVIPNGGNGLVIRDGSRNVVESATIAGNGFDGVVFERGSQNGLVSCRIGLVGDLLGEPSSFHSAPNGGRGVRLRDSPGNLIEGNLIGGNELEGLSLEGTATRENVVVNTRIGLVSDRASSEAVSLPNGTGGIVLRGARLNTIGDLAPGLANVISGNGGPGIALFEAVGNRIVNNEIGTEPRGPHRELIGNAGPGILLAGADETAIEQNRITGNQSGIIVRSGFANSLLQNSIRDNAGMPIDLNDDGPTRNDVGDLDDGPNGLQNSPALRILRNPAGAATGLLDTTPLRPGVYRLDLYEDQSLDSVSVIPVDVVNVIEARAGADRVRLRFFVSAVEGQTFRAALTDIAGNTSELSPPIRAELDSDGDLEADTDELLGPNNGDGNHDGTPDALQANVFTISSVPPEKTPPASSELLVVELGPNSVFETFRSKAPPKQTDSNPPPKKAVFPVGVLDVRGHVERGGRTIVTIFLPTGTTVNTYLKFGPTPDDANPHWYEWLFDGQVGAQLLQEKIILHLMDGAKGDDDLLANGIIQDIGGPAFLTALRLGISVPDAAGQLQLTLEGLDPGRTYALEASESLTAWEEVSRTQATGATARFQDALTPAKGQRFYRAVRLGQP